MIVNEITLNQRPNDIHFNYYMSTYQLQQWVLLNSRSKIKMNGFKTKWQIHNSQLKSIQLLKIQEGFKTGENSHDKSETY